MAFKELEKQEKVLLTLRWISGLDSLEWFRLHFLKNYFGPFADP